MIGVMEMSYVRLEFFDERLELLTRLEIPDNSQSNLGLRKKRLLFIEILHLAYKKLTPRG